MMMMMMVQRQRLRSYYMYILFVQLLLLQTETVNSFSFPPFHHQKHAPQHRKQQFISSLLPSFTPPRRRVTNHCNYLLSSYSAISSRLQSSTDSENSVSTIDPKTLMDMDIILYTLPNNENGPNKKQYIGAIQEDLTLAPLSAWTTECAFDTFIECLVDEHDRWKRELSLDNEENSCNVVITKVLEEPFFSYGSRQVGGGKGLGNPHGEESELLYYIDAEILVKEGVDIPLKPELEILW